jgi:hypothetical protein
MLRIIDDTTNNSNVTTFEFNNGDTIDAIQSHGTQGAPFIAQCKVTQEQQALVKQYSNCVLIARLTSQVV